MRNFLVAIISIGCTASIARAELPPMPTNLQVSAAKTAAINYMSGRTQLVVDDDPAATAANKNHLKVLAQWLAYRLLEAPYNGEPGGNASGPTQDMNTLMADVDRYCRIIALSQDGKSYYNDAHAQYALYLGEALKTEIELVLKEATRPIESINAVRMLSLACVKMPATGVADLLIKIINDKDASLANQLYAFDGVANLLSHSDFTEPTKHYLFNGEKLGEMATALHNFVVMPRQFKNTEEVQVLAYVRRNAVRALGTFKDSVIRNNRKEIIARPAWTLMHFLATSPQLMPAPTPHERFEAAIGLASMTIDQTLNVELSAYWVYTNVVFLARVANDDSNRAAKSGAPVSLPWKIYAARLNTALQIWQQSAKKLPAARNPDSITRPAKDVTANILEALEKSGAGANVNATGITAVLQASPYAATAGLMFSDLPSSTVPFPQVAPKTAPPAKKP
ncbi:MAG: hypothetical protein R3B84_07260 [Zavarzinella sp.]